MEREMASIIFSAKDIFEQEFGREVRGYSRAEVERVSGILVPPNKRNGRTQDKPGQILPVVITVYEDKSFEFIIKTPPAAVQLLEASKVKKGSGEPNRNKVGSVTWEQVQKIAEDKMADLNCFTIDSALSMVAGTARSMGLKVTGTKPNA